MSPDEVKNVGKGETELGEERSSFVVRRGDLVLVYVGVEIYASIHVSHEASTEGIVVHGMSAVEGH